MKHPCIIDNIWPFPGVGALINNSTLFGGMKGQKKCLRKETKDTEMWAELKKTIYKVYFYPDVFECLGTFTSFQRCRCIHRSQEMICREKENQNKTNLPFQETSQSLQMRLQIWLFKENLHWGVNLGVYPEQCKPYDALCNWALACKRHFHVLCQAVVSMHLWVINEQNGCSWA